ncbi:MAG: DUF2147 domain-containing protein, partial [Gemmataceae bacterium]|nr:DUF2147 domain-containing protein [Gemmataceae bacterium]
MHRNVRIAGLVAASVLFAVYAAVALQGDDILGMWVTEGGKGRVEITKDGETYTGRLVWLREPDYPAGDQEAGKSKHDRNNPDEALRDRPIVGLAVLQGFKFDGEATWAKGTIYDPENGKTYKCKIT